MEGFKFSNEEIVWMYLIFSNYIKTVKDSTSKTLALSKGQLELMYNIYGKDDDFDQASYELHNRLINEELPKMMKERCDFISNISDRFKDSYELIADVDPDLVEIVRKELVDEPTNVSDILNQLNEKNDNYED